eukprot:TRINITY_DN53640_c0_g1_i1.p1 TRINITY_DN53640_c0_g1~~TRINITY_DN53640_c0_g1_i1.p1  ORF type:complete len:287 (-),score=43.98 TRINITY_DN53640_c0_g1_i1:44-904(-)
MLGTLAAQMFAVAASCLSLCMLVDGKRHVLGRNDFDGKPDVPPDPVVRSDYSSLYGEIKEQSDANTFSSVKLLGSAGGIALKMELLPVGGIWATIDLAKDSERQSMWKVYAPQSRIELGKDVSGTVVQDARGHYHVEPQWRHHKTEDFTGLTERRGDAISKYCKDAPCKVEMWKNSTGWHVNILGSTFDPLAFPRAQCVGQVLLFNNNGKDYQTRDECKAKCASDSRCNFYMFGHDTQTFEQNTKVCMTYTSCSQRAEYAGGVVNVYKMRAAYERAVQISFHEKAA